MTGWRAAGHVRLVCTDRGQHRPRLIGIVDINDGPDAAVRKGNNALRAADEDRGPAWSRNVSRMQNQAGSWTYHVLCETCRRQPRIPWQKLAQFAAAHQVNPADLDISLIPM